MPHKKLYVGKKKAEEDREAKKRCEIDRAWREYCCAEIHRLYGADVDADSITCLHCALNVINEEGYISDNEMAKIRNRGRLRAPLSFDPTPEPEEEL